MSIVDEKAGLSSICRRGDHASCQSAGAVCSCSCHTKRNGRTPRPAVGDSRPPWPETAAKADAPLSEGLEVGDPPKSKSNRTNSIVDPAYVAWMQAHPGIWAKVKTSRYGGATGAVRKALGASYEVTGRHLGDKEHGTWARKL